jgi:tetratricopeptide (TPR) repeat protein
MTAAPPSSLKIGRWRRAEWRPALPPSHVTRRRQLEIELWFFTTGKIFHDRRQPIRGRLKMPSAPALPIITWLLLTVPALAQDVRTQAPCSPVIDRTQGNVTVSFSGGCTVGITPAELKDIIDNVLSRRAIPPELLDRYEILSRSFGVTDAALTTFFRVLGERKVATEDLDAKLREVAARHLALLKQAQASSDDDAQVAAIKQEAVAAIAAGDYDRAEDLLKRAYDEDLAAAEHAQDAANKRYLTAAKTRADIGQLNWTQLRYAAAAQDFQQAANLVPAGEALVRSRYLVLAGLTAISASNYPLAGTALTEALSIQERMLGPEDPEVAADLNNLASLYQDEGRYSEAEPLFKRAVAIGDKVLGPEHPDVAVRLSNLAMLYKDQQRYAEAEPLAKRALAISEKALGPEDPEVATRANNLAVVYRYQGRIVEAEPLLKRALAIGDKALGPEHPDVAVSLSNLAMLYRDLDRYAEAEPLARRALAIDEKVLGPEHPEVAVRLNVLALLCKEQGRQAEAEPLFKRALAISEKALGPGHPITRQIREDMRRDGPQGDARSELPR